MSAFARRLRTLETIRQRQAPRAVGEVDSSRLSAAQLARVRELGERIELVGVEGLTQDELMECAEVREAIEVGTRP